MIRIDKLRRLDYSQYIFTIKLTEALRNRRNIAREILVIVDVVLVTVWTVVTYHIVVCWAFYLLPWRKSKPNRIYLFRMRSILMLSAIRESLYTYILFSFLSKVGDFHYQRIYDCYSVKVGPDLRLVFKDKISYEWTEIPL